MENKEKQFKEVGITQWGCYHIACTGNNKWTKEIV
jgi:hypothetical protein